MRYIVSPEEMRALEAEVFEQGVSSLLLMETAARRAFEVLCGMTDRGSTAVFLCGPGNNGGDGLAMARMFHTEYGRSRVILPQEPGTPDAGINLQYAKALGIPVCRDAEGMQGAQVIVDALFGTGFRGTVDPESGWGLLINAANAGGVPILAVDIPSGMNGLTGETGGACIRASKTVTFHAAKRGLVFTPHQDHTGEVIVADIGLSRHAGIPCAQDLREVLPPRAANAHKGDCGRVVICAGSTGMAGAAVMAAMACLRAGSGLVTVVCPRSVIPILQKTVPNAMCLAAEEEPQIRCDVCLMGPGLEETEEAWNQILSLHGKGALEVWDAGALNLLAKHPMSLGKQAVITPHVGEAARLLECDTAGILADMPGAASELSHKYRCSSVLKSSVTVMYTWEGQMAVNTVGSPALAKGGSGDALAGILASLLGQGIPMLEAMQAACLWHGRAGQLAGQKYGIRSALTGEVIECMGDAARIVDE